MLFSISSLVLFVIEKFVPFQGRFSRRRKYRRKYAYWRRLRSLLSLIVEIRCKVVKSRCSITNCKLVGYARQDILSEILVGCISGRRQHLTTFSSRKLIKKLLILRHLHSFTPCSSSIVISFLEGKLCHSYLNLFSKV